jgi:hypothetical protein
MEKTEILERELRNLKLNFKCDDKAWIRIRLGRIRFAVWIRNEVE